jgi:hypothetical protein
MENNYIEGQNSHCRVIELVEEDIRDSKKLVPLIYGTV